MSPVWQPPAASGGGAVATDVIWDTKGDLAAATGADAAVKVAAGANGTTLIADSAQSAGVAWSVPIGTIVDYVEWATDITVTATTEAAAQTVVTGAGWTPNGTDSFWIEFFCPALVTGGTAGSQVRFSLYDNGSAVSAGILGQFYGPTGGSGAPGLLRRKVTPSNAAHAYSIRAWRITANGAIYGTNAGAGQPGYIAITKAS